MYADKSQYDNDERNLLTEIRERLYQQGWVTPRKHNPEVDEWTLVFDTERACSSCRRTGLVPRHHRYLCLICWATNGMMQPTQSEYHLHEPMHEEPLLSEYAQLQGEDTPADSPPRVYKEIVYSSEDMTQEELQAILS